MEQRHLKLLLPLALAAIAVSCAREQLGPDASGDGFMLNFQCKAPVATKASGDDPYNENLLKTIDYFLYPADGAASNAVWHERIVANTSSGQYTANIALTDYFVLNTLFPGTNSECLVYAIANYPTNIGGSANGLVGTSIPQLESLVASFHTTLDVMDTVQDDFVMSTNGAVRVTLLSRRKVLAAEGIIPLERVASKITVAIKVADTVVVNSIRTIGSVADTIKGVWWPDTTNMSIYLVNGAQTARMRGDTVTPPSYFTSPASTFEYEDESDYEQANYYTYDMQVDGEDTTFVKATHTGIFHPLKDMPAFYTYPVKWKYGDDEEPYLKLQISWTRKAGISTSGSPYGTVSKTYYYKVYAPGRELPTGDGAEFVRNTWYKVVLNVGILGSETDGANIIIRDATYYVCDWQERNAGTTQGGQETPDTLDTDKPAEIKGARYLSVTHVNHTLYNVDSLKIPYTSSDECETVVDSAYYYDYSTANAVLKDIPSNKYSVDIEYIGDKTYVVLRHTLNNDISGTDFDISSFHFKITLRHRGDDTYSRVIRITQLPAIQIVADPNSGNNNNYGYAYVNGSQGSNTNSTTYYTTNNTNSNINTGRGWNYYLGSAPRGIDDKVTNKNLSMFVIETSVFPHDSEYMLGDPRTTYVDNMNTYQTWPASSTAAQRVADAEWSYSSYSVQYPSSNQRKLKYYHPVDNSHNVDDIIAPKFRIASSYGATISTRYVDAFRRCAAYQEDGYPAGRWRVPTVAEIKYIAKLNTEGKIQRLLGALSVKDGENGDDQNDNWQASKTNTGCYSEYWCNSGYMRVYDGKNSNWTNANGGKIPDPELGEDESAMTDRSVYKSIRCVYDDWFWENTDYVTCSKTTFTWGDINY